LLALDVDPAPEVEPELFPELPELLPEPDDDSEADLPESDLPGPSEEDAAAPAGLSELLPESPEFEADLDPLAA